MSLSCKRRILKRNQMYRVQNLQEIKVKKKYYHLLNLNNYILVQHQIFPKLDNSKPLPSFHLTPLSLPTPLILQSLPPPPPLSQVPPIMMANVHVAPKIHNIVHTPYFLGRQGSNVDTHIENFEITCQANDVPAATFQEVFVASLQENAFAWYQSQPPFANWNALRAACLAHFRPLGFAINLKRKL